MPARGTIGLAFEMDSMTRPEVAQAIEAARG